MALLLDRRPAAPSRARSAARDDLPGWLREPTPQEARVALAALRLALAGGWLTPDAMARAFGIDPSRQEALAVVGRLFAARDAMMGAALLQADGHDLDRWLRWGVAVDLADAAALLLGGLRRRVPWRAALTGAAVAGAAAYLGAVARRG